MNHYKTRCAWGDTWASCKDSDTQMREYHDTEWGKPCHDERKLFEMLTLEGAQAGLSWATILHKRENYRKAFDDWKIEKIAAYDEYKITQLLLDSGIVRNRLKIRSKDMKKQGFKFVGSTIVYSYLQAIGVINDHILSCDFREHK